MSMQALTSNDEPIYGAINPQGFIPARPISEYALGVDLGQANDSTAIALVEHRRDPVPPPEGIGADLIQKLGPDVYILKRLSRVPLGTSYVTIAGIVGNLLARPEIRERCELVIDFTGVGRAVGDIFEHCGLSFTGVTIVGGNGARSAGANGYNVSKMALISRLTAEFHARTLKLPKNLTLAAELLNELANFRANISDSGVATFGARAGKHDDLVLALAIATWYLSDRGGGWAVQEIDL
jgi:hypothetical protein